MNREDEFEDNQEISKTDDDTNRLIKISKISTAQKELKEEKFDDEHYSKGKPERRKIKAKLIHDKN